MGNPQHFVTLIDKTYASRALALFKSLDRHSASFKLWIVAADSYTEELFSRLGLDNVAVVPLREVETDALQQARVERSLTEYFWTLSPFVFDWVFDREVRASQVTYIDADLWLTQPTDFVLEGFAESEADVLITEHAYHPAFDFTKTSGFFCVQFLSVKRDSAKDIVELWKQQCLDWCFSYSEGGRFGDQGYLTEWPRTYGSRVYVPQKQHFQGPWNAMRFPYSEALTYHFHSFAYFGKKRFSVGVYPIPMPHRENIYVSYVEDLEWAEKEISSCGMHLFGRGSFRARIRAWRNRLRLLRVMLTTH